MIPCTKEALLAAMNTVEELEAFEGVSLYFIATGNGGCDGPPSVTILERRNEIAKETIDKDRNNIQRTNTSKFITTGTCIVGVKMVEVFLGRKERESWDESSATLYYFKDYKSIDILAEAIIKQVLQKYKITIL